MLGDVMEFQCDGKAAGFGRFTTDAEIHQTASPVIDRLTTTGPAPFPPPTHPQNCA